MKQTINMRQQLAINLDITIQLKELHKTCHRVACGLQVSVCPPLPC